MKERERQRWKKKVQDKKVIQIRDMGDSAKRNQRKYLREARKKGPVKVHWWGQIPPDNPQDQNIQECNICRQSLRQERERRKMRKRHLREIKNLKKKLEKVTKQLGKLRKQK